MKKLKVGHYTYDILCIPIPSGEEGLCIPRDLEIYVAPCNNLRRELDALFHECLHALWDYHGLGSHADEESAVRALATGILTLLEDNPALRKKLLE